MECLATEGRRRYIAPSGTRARATSRSTAQALPFGDGTSASRSSTSRTPLVARTCRAISARSPDAGKYEQPIAFESPSNEGFMIATPDSYPWSTICCRRIRFICPSLNTTTTRSMPSRTAVSRSPGQARPASPSTQSPTHPDGRRANRTGNESHRLESFGHNSPRGRRTYIPARDRLVQPASAYSGGLRLPMPAPQRGATACGRPARAPAGWQRTYRAAAESAMPRSRGVRCETARVAGSRPSSTSSTRAAMASFAG